ncbi:nucleotidyltransferase family protein [Patescibacteria group bacterium]|nr:nucleotidyltransferase family protein [Patescibacteria group bacterium]
MNQCLSNYKAIILAGGKGTRLYPVTKEIPKPLLPVKRKPIINYLINLFYSQGIKEIAVLINKDFREDFDWWQKRYYSKNKIKLVQESKPLGTLGGLCFLKDWISNKPFFLTNGDELKKIDLIEMNKFHQRLKTPATIALVKVPDPQHYGVVISKNGRVEEFLEKPSPSQISKRNLEGQANYINSGLYLLSPEIFNYHSGPQFSMIETDLFPKLAKEKKLAGFKFHDKWTDCGTWERYEKALREWK